MEAPNIDALFDKVSTTHAGMTILLVHYQVKSSTALLCTLNYIHLISCLYFLNTIHIPYMICENFSLAYLSDKITNNKILTI